jgi:hypothetical protein
MQTFLPFQGAHTAQLALGSLNASSFGLAAPTLGQPTQAHSLLDRFIIAKPEEGIQRLVVSAHPNVSTNLLSHVSDTTQNLTVARANQQPGRAALIGALTVAGLPGIFSDEPVLEALPGTPILTQAAIGAFAGSTTAVDVLLMDDAFHTVGIRRLAEQFGVNAFAGLVETLLPKVLLYQSSGGLFVGKQEQTHIIGLDSSTQHYVTIDFDLEGDGIDVSLYQKDHPDKISLSDIETTAPFATGLVGSFLKITDGLELEMEFSETEESITLQIKDSEQAIEAFLASLEKFLPTVSRAVEAFTPDKSSEASITITIGKGRSREVNILVQSVKGDVWNNDFLMSEENKTNLSAKLIA